MNKIDECENKMTGINSLTVPDVCHSDNIYNSTANQLIKTDMKSRKIMADLRFNLAKSDIKMQYIPHFGGARDPVQLETITK